MSGIIHEVEPELFYYQSRTLARHVEIMSLPTKMGAMALAGFALLALVMAATGLYGTVSYPVAQRTPGPGSASRRRSCSRACSRGCFSASGRSTP